MKKFLILAIIIFFGGFFSPINSNLNNQIFAQFAGQNIHGDNEDPLADDGSEEQNFTEDDDLEIDWDAIDALEEEEVIEDTQYDAESWQKKAQDKYAEYQETKTEKQKTEIQENITLASKYHLDGDYEYAVITYKKIINIIDSGIQIASAEGRARKAFEGAQKAERKNERKYKIALKEIIQYLTPAQQASKVGEIKFEWIAEGIESKHAPDGNNVDWDKALIEYAQIANLFEDVQENTVKEVRYSIANGGILPGSRDVEGSKYAGDTLLPKFTNTLLILTLSLSTLMLIIGGVMYVFSYGEEDTKKKAKEIIFWTIGGTAIVLLSFALVKFIININFEI